VASQKVTVVSLAAGVLVPRRLVDRRWAERVVDAVTSCSKEVARAVVEESRAEGVWVLVVEIAVKVMSARQVPERRPNKRTEVWAEINTEGAFEPDLHSHREAACERRRQWAVHWDVPIGATGCRRFLWRRLSASA